MGDDLDGEVDGMTDLMQVIAELTNECVFAAWAGQEPSIGGQRIEGAKESKSLDEFTRGSIDGDHAFCFELAERDMNRPAWVQWAGLPSLRECRTVLWMQRSPQIKNLVRASLKASFRAHPRRQILQRASHPSQSQRCPLALYMLHTSWSGAWELNINSERRPVCKRDTLARAL